MNKGPPGNFYDPAGPLANDLYKRLSIFPPDVPVAKVSLRFFLSPEPAPFHESCGTRNACWFATSAPKKVPVCQGGCVHFCWTRFVQRQVFFRIPCCQWPRRPTSTWSPLFLQSCLRATRLEHRVSFRASFFHGVIGVSGDRSIAIVPTPSTRLQRVMRARISVHEDQFPPGSPRSESVGIISGSRGGCRPWAF